MLKKKWLRIISGAFKSLQLKEHGLAMTICRNKDTISAVEDDLDTNMERNV